MTGQRTILIVPQYGGQDRGPTGNGTVSRDITLAIGVELRRRLQEAGYRVVMSRDTDVFHRPEDITAFAQRLRDGGHTVAATIVLGTNYAARGIHGIQLQGGGAGDQNQQLLQAVTNALSGLGPGDDRPPINGTPFSNFLHQLGTSVGIRLGNVNNADDAALLRSAGWQNQVVTALTTAIQSFVPPIEAPVPVPAVRPLRPTGG
jgi:N-acetylmuramoyl-L-alanine amidase